MNYKDKLNKIMDDIDPGYAEFTVHVDDLWIRPREVKWVANVEGEGLYNRHVRKYCYRQFVPPQKKWVIDRDHTITAIEQRVVNSMDAIFIKCSPASAPKRTKLYKSFKTIVQENRSIIEFVNSIFDIAEYYSTVTESNDISNSHNDVHRKNIFQLLNLMEKSYANKSKTNSNR